MARSFRIRPRALSLLALAGPGVALAIPAAAQQQSLAGCLAIQDVALRVQCYDAIAQAQQAAPPAPAAGPAMQPVAPPAAGAAPPPPPPSAQADPVSNPQQDFGLTSAQREARRPDVQQQLQELSLTVSTTRPVGPGYWQLGMSNGSTWRVEEVLRSFRPPKSGDRVTIVRGALGAYYLDADRQPRVRIKRIG